MKTTFVKKIILASALIIGQHCHSQGFQNLDFEDAAVVLANPPFPQFVYGSGAIPGWTAYLNGIPQGVIYYDTVSIGGAIVALEDSNAPGGGGPLPIQGNYSVLLEGSIPNAATAASIGQSGTIPNIAQSLTFFGNLAGNLQVTFNGQNIPYSAIGNGADYTIYGADIASYAGQTGQLLFTTPGNNSTALLDNIQFSPSPVPEPSELALGALGALLLGFRRRWNSI